MSLQSSTLEIAGAPSVGDPTTTAAKVDAEVQKTNLPFDPVALKQKYLDERNKRLNNSQSKGHHEQYQFIENGGQFSHLLDNPWVKPGYQRSSIDEEVDVVVIGAGYAALNVIAALLKAGIKNIRIIEKGGDFGGTWYWNRYPGAQCDVESYIYMPLLEELNYIPTEKYAHQPELFRHAQNIGKHFGLYEKALFQTEVLQMEWNEQSTRWIITTNRGDTIRGTFVVPVAGPFFRPKLPGVKGLSNFKGHTFHTARWDYAYTGGDTTGNLTGLRDKRVGIIGTGATAIQSIPYLAKDVKELYVFQRTPSSVDVRGNAPTDQSWVAGLQEGWQKERMDNFNMIANGIQVQKDLVNDGWTDILYKFLGQLQGGEQDATAIGVQRQLADFEKMEKVRARVDQFVKDPKTAESLKPWFNQMCKRPTFNDDYLPAFNRPNVHLIDTSGKGIDEVTETGIKANGQIYEIDALIYATGFDYSTSHAHQAYMKIIGRNGITLADYWGEGAKTLHGWTTHNFPNCFWISIIQAAVSPNYVHCVAELGEHLAYIISECKKRGIKTVEPASDTEAKWVSTIEELTVRRNEFLKECTPGYYNNEGELKSITRNSSYGAGAPEFMEILQKWRAKNDLSGLDLQYQPNAVAAK